MKRLVLYIFIVTLCSCVIDPIPGRIITQIYTDATEYNLTINCIYKDYCKTIVVSYPENYKRIESWHTDVYEYTYSYTYNGTYFYGNVHIVYPNEYEFKDIKIE